MTNARVKRVSETVNGPFEHPRRSLHPYAVSFIFPKKSVQAHREARICCRYSHIRSNCMRKMKNPSSVSSSDLCIEPQRRGGVHHSVSLRLRFITQLRPDHL